jgi:hypothetical protein
MIVYMFYRNPRMRQGNSSIPPSTIDDSTTTMAPKLAVSTHELTQNIIKSKLNLEGDQGPKDERLKDTAFFSTEYRTAMKKVVSYGDNGF